MYEDMVHTEWFRAVILFFPDADCYTMTCPFPCSFVFVLTVRGLARRLCQYCNSMLQCWIACLDKHPSLTSLISMLYLMSPFGTARDGLEL